MITALLFDLDNLLSDTETLHCRAYQQVLRSHGYTLTHEEFHNHWVRDGLAIADLCKLHQLPHDPKGLHNEKVLIYQHLVKTECRPMPGAREILDRVFGKKRLALVTASAKDSADAVLDALNFRRYFEIIVTASDVVRRKPHPDLFLKAAELLGIPPRECLVLEDAEKGIVAAHAAGMRSIAIPTADSKHHNFSLATHTANFLTEIPNSWLDL